MKFLLLLFISISSFGQSDLDTVKLLSKKIIILAPHDLKTMSDQMWNLKYQQRPRPMLVLSDEAGEVNLIGDLTKQPASEAQLAAFKDFQIESLKSKRPDFQLLSDGVKSVNSRQVGYFKFLSTAIDQKVFNYYFFTIYEGKILLFSFNCIEKLRKDWEGPADGIVGSLRVL